MAVAHYLSLISWWFLEYEVECEFGDESEDFESFEGSRLWRFEQRGEGEELAPYGSRFAYSGERRGRVSLRGTGRE